MKETNRRSYNNEKTVITGAGGMVGSYFDFGVRCGRKEMDIIDEKAVAAIFKKIKPELVIHLAAATDVEKCERDPEYAWRTNVLGTYNIAKYCRKYGAKMVYVSTNAVFGGNKFFHAEPDAPDPQSVYGRTKYEGELTVKGLVPYYLIARTSWVFGGGRKLDHKFVGKIIRKQKTDKEIFAVSDFFCSATYAKDFVSRLKELLRKNREGIFHVVNSGKASRYDMALEIGKFFDYQGIIKRARYRDFGSAAKIDLLHNNFSQRNEEILVAARKDDEGVFEQNTLRRTDEAAAKISNCSRKGYCAVGLISPGILKYSLPPMGHWKSALWAYLKGEWEFGE